MATLAALQARLEQVEKDIASGTEAVRHGETSRTMRSLSDLLRIKALLEKDIAMLGGSATYRTVRINTRTGY